MTFAEGMKKRRKELRITQRELSEKSGVPQSTISAVEKGDRIPTEETMTMIARGLSCGVGFILGEDATKNVATIAGSDVTEAEMINLFRNLSPEKKAYLKGILEGLAAAHKP